MSESVTRKLMLFFPKCECEKPIIYHLVRDYNLLLDNQLDHPVFDNLFTDDPRQIDEEEPDALSSMETSEIVTGQAVLGDAPRQL